MHRRTLLRSGAALLPIALAGCGQYESGSGSLSAGNGGSSGGAGTDTTPEFAPYEQGALEVSYSRLDAESDGEAVAMLTVANAATEARSASLTVHFATGNGTGSAVRVIEVPPEDRERVRIPLGEPVDGLEMTNFTFGPPT